jgi:hypothetical protein
MDLERPLPPSRGYVKPLGLPVGSVRALLLLALTARAVIDLRAGRGLADWLGAALVVSAASYFAARAAGGGSADGRPLGLPRGTIRVLFLAGLVYGATLYFRETGLSWERTPALWVLAAFLVGSLVRAVLRRARVNETDVGTSRIYHLQALLTLAAAGALVFLGVRPDVDAPSWVHPLLAACCTYYAGAR